MEELFIITTTNNVEDSNISEYIGIIKSNCTAGIGIFGDIAAGFTDIFGGRSETFEKQMKIIDDTAIEGLVEKAKALGADAIVGLRIDNDEISGKGTQMLMVTAYGTAVKLKNNNVVNRRKEVIGLNELRKVEEKDKIISKSKKVPFEFNSEEWQFIYKEKVVEIVNDVIKNLSYWENSYTDVNQEKIQYLKRYLVKFGSHLKSIIYRAIIDYPILCNKIMDIIQIANICDYENVIMVLKESTFDIRKNVIKIVKYEKEEYSKEDIKHIKELIILIDSIFPIKATIVEEKVFLSTSLQKKWICSCGEKNNIEDKYCKKCNNDQYGFDRYDVSKEEIIKYLDLKIKNIEKTFNQKIEHITNASTL